MSSSAPEAPRPRPRLRPARALLAVLLGLLTAELGLRAYASVTHRARGVTLDDELGWRMLPRVAKVGGEWGDGPPATTNAQGWRDRETPFEPPAGVRRIVALGDSFTFGQNVPYGARFTELLERADLDVVNLGVCAYGPDQELLAYRREGRRYRPDVVLWTLFLGNDLDDLVDSRRSGWSKPQLRVRDGALALVPPRHGLRAVARAHSYLAEILVQLVERGAPSRVRAADAAEVDRVALLAAIASELERAVREDGARLVVALAHPREPRAGEAKAVRTALAAAGVDLVDLGPALAVGGRPLDELFLPCGHWSAAGHALVAAALAPRLEAALAR